MSAQIERVVVAPALSAGNWQQVAGGAEVAGALSVGLLLGDGQVAWGDCVGGGAAFRRDEALAVVQRIVAPALEGRALARFRDLAAEVDALTEAAIVTRPRHTTDSHAGALGEPDGQEGISRRALLTAPARLLQQAAGQPPTGELPVGPLVAIDEEAPTGRAALELRLQPAIRYGVSQALLQAVALARGMTMARVVADEWGLATPEAPVPIHAQCGYEQRRQADRMILHRVASLSHGSIDDVAQQVGADGGHLTRYLRWLSERIPALGGDQYQPAIHLELAGALGQITEHHPGHMLGHLYAWRLAARPFCLRLEDPVLLEDRQAQTEALSTLHDYLRLRRIDVELVAGRGLSTLDDLAAFLAARSPDGRPPVDMVHLRMPELGSLHNTVEAVLACQQAGVGVLLGGSTAETNIAARTAVHVALATRPDLIVARPGRDVDTAVSLVRNEMARTLAIIAADHPGAGAGHGRLRT